MNLPQKKPLTLKSTSDPSAIASQATSTDERTQPIPPPSHPRQYRAIGLVRGKYQITEEEQITQGKLVTSDGTEIEAVLLGRVISLVKKHLDLEQEHLWVVYPRTKVKSDCLHLQIMGVWEPETLSQDEEEAAALSNEEIQENYFSIRGEVVFYDLEKEVVVIKIKQFPRKEGDKPKSFKLLLKGVLEGKPLRHFWDLNVNLEGEALVIPPGEATDLGFAQKKPRFQKKPTKKFFSPPKPNTNSATSRPNHTNTNSETRPKPKINKPTKNSNS
jgi:hypothetical protein